MLAFLLNLGMFKMFYVYLELVYGCITFNANILLDEIITHSCIHTLTDKTIL